MMGSPKTQTKVWREMIVSKGQTAVEFKKEFHFLGVF
jgi:hypothetical protein